MSAAELKELRKEIKHQIDLANEKKLLAISALLQDDDSDWWASMPDNVKADLNVSLKQAERGETMTHDQVKKKHSQWFMK